MRTLSWVLLTILGAILLYFSLASARVAYFPRKETVGGVPLSDAAVPESTRTLNLARRGTAAAYAAAFSTLFLFVVLGPYRRGDVCSWWALLVSLLVLNLVTILRVPLLGVKAGVGAAAIPLGIGLVALLLDVPRLWGASLPKP